MALLIKLYGDLREKMTQINIYEGTRSTLELDIDDIKDVSDILDKLNIKNDEISHIFVNSKYSRLEKEVKNGDRIGLFPKRMGILFVEIKDPF